MNETNNPPESPDHSATENQLQQRWPELLEMMRNPVLFINPPEELRLRDWWTGRLNIKSPAHDHIDGLIRESSETSLGPEDIQRIELGDRAYSELRKGLR